MATRKVNSVWLVAAAWAIAAALMVVGCDRPLSRATTADGDTVDTVAINPDDDAEITAVAALKVARAKYDSALSVLRAYYEKTGALDEQTWAGRELENLEDAQAFSFEGVAVVTETPRQSLDDANEPAWSRPWSRPARTGRGPWRRWASTTSRSGTDSSWRWCGTSSSGST